MDRLAQTFCRAFNLVIMTALLAGCGTGAPRQYQTAVSNFASEGVWMRHRGNVAFP